MTLRLYDTRVQQLRDFVPLDASHVTVYVCGPTVQSAPHIGHVRAAIAFDVLRRWLSHRFGRVTLVRNVTDVDDKVLAQSTADEPWWALAYRMEREFTAAYDAVGVLRPTYEPRATGSIPQMIELIALLVQRGHAYPADDASGDVYFDVRSWPDYGSLTHQEADAMESAGLSDTDASGPGRAKRHPQDFALWKGAKAEEPADASWASPWGPGRPGWHIECSAMARRYLGERFDIHGGGRDLRFPHHENELAQSSAAGDGFAGYWVHNGLVTLGGQKMSKSLGTATAAAEVLGEYDPLVVRYALAAAHYRSNLDLSAASYTEAEAALQRVRSFLQRVRRAGAVAPAAEVDALPSAFQAAMDDDLSVPQALAVVHEAVRRGNTALDDGDTVTAGTAAREVSAMLAVLGLVPGEDASDDGVATALDTLLRTLIAQRARARQEHDWAAADRIRDAIAAAGVTLEDTADGTHWSTNG